MNGATQAGSAGTLPGVDYRLEVKGADWPDPAVPEKTLTDSSDPNAPRWAGDLYEEGDESDPVEAFAAFTGEEGQTAWLDVSPDGTVTGWVKDGEEVYRYSDPNAWALDVDGASMSRAGELSTDPEGAVEDGEEDPDADGDAEGDTDDDGDGAEETDPAEQEIEVDDTEGHDPNGDTPKMPGDGVAPESNLPEGATAGDDGMKPEDDNFYTRMKKKGEKKSLAIRVRAQ